MSGVHTYIHSACPAGPSRSASHTITITITIPIPSASASLSLSLSRTSARPPAPLARSFLIDYYIRSLHFSPPRSLTRSPRQLVYIDISGLRLSRPRTNASASQLLPGKRKTALRSLQASPQSNRGPSRCCSRAFQQRAAGQLNRAQQSPNMAGTGAGPSRRSHTKSRKGCKTCKRRHIRCDETFPQWFVPRTRIIQKVTADERV